jgi:hypothetical protein
MQLPLGALLHVWRLTCSCATARSRPEQGAPLFIVHSFVCMQLPLGALLHVWRLTCSCAATRSRPLTKRTSVHRSLVCCCMQVPLGALLHVWRLTCSCATSRSRPLTRRTSVRRSLVLLLYAGALGCPPARLAPHLQLRDFTISSFNKAHLCSSFTLLFVCSCPWVPSCTFGASLAAARLHDLVL